MLVGLGEHVLDGVLEGEVERLGGEVTEDVGEISTPEGWNTLFRSNPREAVANASVTGNLSGNDLGVGILGLDEELDALDGSGAGLGDGARDTAGKEVQEEIATGSLTWEDTKGNRLHKTHNERQVMVDVFAQTVILLRAMRRARTRGRRPACAKSGLSYGSRCQQYRRRRAAAAAAADCLG